MPNNNVSDAISDQEIAFVHLVLSGTMTDRRAAKAAGLKPDAAAYIKSKPCVRAYMLERRAAVRQQPVEQGTGLPRLPRLVVGLAVEEQPRSTPSRDQVLTRLWEIANLSHEVTRGSLTGQVKALSMIVAIEGMIPDRRAAAAQNKPAHPPITAQIYQAEWLRKQRGELDPQEQAHSEPQPAPAASDDPPPVSSPTPDPTPEPPSISAAPLEPAPSASLVPRVPMADYVAPDTRVPRSLSMRMGLRRR